MRKISPKVGPHSRAPEKGMSLHEPPPKTPFNASILKFEEEKHYRCPVLADAARITQRAVAAILNLPVLLHIANGSVAAVLHLPIVSQVAHGAVTAILNAPITPNVANRAVAVVQNRTIFTDIPLRTITAVLDRAVVLDIACRSGNCRLESIDLTFV